MHSAAEKTRLPDYQQKSNYRANTLASWATNWINSSKKYLQCPPCHVWHIWWSNSIRKTFRHNIRSYEWHQLLCHTINVTKDLLQKLTKSKSFIRYSKAHNFIHLYAISVQPNYPKHYLIHDQQLNIIFSVWKTLLHVSSDDSDTQSLSNSVDYVSNTKTN